tara:strand:+ start:249 stop:479 length:231 start_codon:yes stop_codon:yes gene_type:complete
MSNYENWSDLEIQLLSDLKICEEIFILVSYSVLHASTSFSNDLLKQTIKELINRGFIKYNVCSRGYGSFISTTPNA